MEDKLIIFLIIVIFGSGAFSAVTTYRQNAIEKVFSEFRKEWKKFIENEFKHLSKDVQKIKGKLEIKDE